MTYLEASCEGYTIWRNRLRILQISKFRLKQFHILDNPSLSLGDPICSNYDGLLVHELLFMNHPR